MSQDAFLAALLETPDDRCLWLVFSDWLEEHGEIEQANKIRAYQAVQPALKNAWRLGMRFAANWLRGIQHVPWKFGRRGRLAAVLNVRWISDHWPIPWQHIQHWPPGWSAETCQRAIRVKLLQAELGAIGFSVESGNWWRVPVVEELFPRAITRAFSGAVRPRTWYGLAGQEKEACRRVMALARSAARSVANYGKVMAVELTAGSLPVAQEMEALAAARALNQARVWRKLRLLEVQKAPYITREMEVAGTCA
jgi:uncharacterized protein (TIGR02996 family)